MRYTFHVECNATDSRRGRPRQEEDCPCTPRLSLVLFCIALSLLQLVFARVVSPVCRFCGQLSLSGQCWRVQCRTKGDEQMRYWPFAVLSVQAVLQERLYLKWTKTREFRLRLVPVATTLFCWRTIKRKEFKLPVVESQLARVLESLVVAAVLQGVKGSVS
jgi:hypothetical protein